MIYRPSGMCIGKKLFTVYASVLRSHCGERLIFKYRRLSLWIISWLPIPTLCISISSGYIVTLGKCIMNILFELALSFIFHLLSEAWALIEALLKLPYSILVQQKLMRRRRRSYEIASALVRHHSGFKTVTLLFIYQSGQTIELLALSILLKPFIF